MSERVSRVVLTERCAPDQQTFSESVGMSQGCQRTKSLRDSPLRG
jgi:hypothetical protein